eukprot:1143247-Pelagomonas_calceolata.AAC.17
MACNQLSQSKPTSIKTWVSKNVLTFHHWVRNPTSCEICSTHLSRGSFIKGTSSVISVLCMTAARPCTAAWSGLMSPPCVLAGAATAPAASQMKAREQLQVSVRPGLVARARARLDSGLARGTSSKPDHGYKVEDVHASQCLFIEKDSESTDLWRGLAAVAPAAVCLASPLAQNPPDSPAVPPTVQKFPADHRWQCPRPPTRMRQVV